MIDPKDLLVERWPQIRGGMVFDSDANKGIKVTHLPTGRYATCAICRSERENRALALRELEKAITI